MDSKYAEMLELRHEGGRLVASCGTTVLEELCPQATVRAEGGAVVLGLHTVGGVQEARAGFSLGKLKAKRFLALGRTSLWWMTPAWGTSTQQIPEETQFLLLELEQEEGGSDQAPAYGLILPLIDSNTFRATLRPASSDNSLAVCIESGAAAVTASSWPSAVLVAAGRDPYELVQRGVAAAARLSGTAKQRIQKEVPASCDVFGWCSWDSFYSRVSAAGLQAGLKSLTEGGAPPRLLIIDDGWQQTDVDPELRAAAASGNTSANGVGLGSAVQEVEEEEAAAGEPSRAQDANQQQQKQPAAAAAAADTAASTSTSGGSGGLVCKAAGWARSACASLAGLLAHLHSSFFNYCKALLERTPANHWRMRLFSVLASSRLVRGPLLSFYASSSDHTRRLVSLKANAKFSSGEAGPEHPLNSSGGDLKSVVSLLKEQYGLRYVYCWHAMAGFWGGLGLSDPEMAAYQPRLVMPTPTPGVLAVDPAVAWVQPVISGVGLPADPSALHQDMHRYLAACGVDGVKVDVQSTIGLLGSDSGLGGGPAAAAAYHASLEQSVRRHFPGNALINCMCHSTEDLYRMEDTNLARVSDDFYPTNPASWTSHIANCAYNTLFMGEVAVPDWDMFHSEHTKGLLHATARAVSGGPVYVSDRPGRHDFELLRRLVLPDGSVLRCLLPGRPTADCLFANPSHDGKTALKVWNANQYTGVVAVFNVQGASFSRPLRRFHTHDPAPPALTATVSPADVPALAAGAAELFAVWCDSRQELTVLAANGSMEVSVAGGGGCDVVTLSPVATAGGIQLAPIGLVGMLNAGGAVLSCSLSGGHSDDGYEVQPARAALQLRGQGTFLCYASHRPCSVTVEGQEVAFSYDDAKAELRFELPPGGAGASAAKDCAIQF